MRHQLEVFSFQKNEVRVLGSSESPWFVASDICAVLGLSNPRDAVSALDDDEKDDALVLTPGGRQRVVTINESGLYSLIFRSNKPEAKIFRKWVTNEVLPSIRKKGFYGAVPRLESRPYDNDRATCQAQRTINELLAAMIEGHLKQYRVFRGNPAKILEWANTAIPREVHEFPLWPGTPNQMKKRLEKAQDALLNRGIAMYCHDTGSRRVLVFWFIDSMNELTLALSDKQDNFLALPAAESKP